MNARERAHELHRAGWLGKDIAAELGVSRSTISRWLNSKNALSGGICECGCGRPTKVNPNTWRPFRFAMGHNTRDLEIDYIEDPDSGCWVWQRGLNYKGYGVCHRDGYQTAHRWYYEKYVGPVPEGLQLDHLCRNRACCNPAHLEPVTAGENARRGRNAKITWRDVQTIRTSTDSARALAQRFGLVETYVYKIRSYGSWGPPGIRAKETA